MHPITVLFPQPPTSSINVPLPKPFLSQRQISVSPTYSTNPSTISVSPPPSSMTFTFIVSQHEQLQCFPVSSFEHVQSSLQMVSSISPKTFQSSKQSTSPSCPQSTMKSSLLCVLQLLQGCKLSCSESAHILQMKLWPLSQTALH